MDTLTENSIESIAVYSHIMSAITLPVGKLAKSDSTEVVKHEKIESTLGVKLNKYSLASTKCDARVFSQLVGHLLGDGSLATTHTSVTPYFVFSQSFRRFDYVWCVFKSLQHYCARVPKIYISYRKNIINSGCQVHTRSYPFLLTMRELFYVKSHNGV